MRNWLCILALLLTPALASAEAIIFELYDVSEQGKPVLLASGTRNYTLEDVITDRNYFGKYRAKEIPVTEGFHAGTVNNRERELRGFALQLKRRGGWEGWLSQGGFSWEWFRHESGMVYRKLQGGGRVRVIPIASSEFQEIAAVEVLEDITLRVMGQPWWQFTQEDSHHLVIRKGSVLRFAP